MVKIQSDSFLNQKCLFWSYKILKKRIRLFGDCCWIWIHFSAGLHSGALREDPHLPGNSHSAQPRGHAGTRSQRKPQAPWRTISLPCRRPKQDSAWVGASLWEGCKWAAPRRCRWAAPVQWRHRSFQSPAFSASTQHSSIPSGREEESDVAFQWMLLRSLQCWFRRRWNEHPLAANRGSESRGRDADDCKFLVLLFKVFLFCIRKFIANSPVLLMKFLSNTLCVSFSSKVFEILCEFFFTIFHLQSKKNITTPRNGEPLIAAIQDFITGELTLVVRLSWDGEYWTHWAVFFE